MSVPKKQKNETDEQVNTKIQQKFDLVFNDSSQDSNEESKAQFKNTNKTEENAMSENKGNKSNNPQDNFSIDLDFGMDGDSDSTKTAIKYETDQLASGDATVVQASSANSNATKVENEGFSLDFDFDGDLENKTQQTVASTPNSMTSTENNVNLSEEDLGMDLEDTFSENTQKTIVGGVDLTRVPVETPLPLPVVDLAAEAPREDMTGGVDLTDDFSFDAPLSQTLSSEEFKSGISSSELMTTDEVKANIESTIKDIIRPKLSQTNEFDLDEMTRADHALEDLLDKTKMFSTNDPGFNFKSTGTNKNELDELVESSEGFNIDEPDFISQVDSQANTTKNKNDSSPQFIQVKGTHEVSHKDNDYSHEQYQATSEESIRNLSTLRSLREEREDLLAQIKNLKAINKEVEQDSLTLKANFEEAKIEITILRKRHMTEIEDLKYRLSLSEEKKLMAEEKARQAELRREKLEQKVRIDFNQVKQREKELESKLELLSMDVDSQVQSRDQKILELRRKIDALEFNMENASMKEQKSSDDKRKLEDRLNKIMKTLRNSIKNLEDDIDYVENERAHTKDKDS